MSENRKLTGKVAMVFGGSRGIGAAAARTGFAIKADSADPTAIRDAVTQTVDQLGRLDIVVVNAGILRLGDLPAVSLQELDIMLKVNVRGVFLAIQAAAAHLSNGGRIITVGSNTAVRSGYPGSSVYAMTKAAVAVMVKGIAVDLAPRGITVNNIQPGPTLTDMTASHIDGVTPAIPLKRVGDPDEIAGLVAYLASDESGYMTGSSLTIDGGMAL
jgi:3-oxoacyl-[acyl-carrier protein] reductase